MRSIYIVILLSGYYVYIMHFSMFYKIIKYMLVDFLHVFFTSRKCAVGEDGRVQDGMLFFSFQYSGKK